MTLHTDLDTDHMSAVHARAAEHLADPLQLHLNKRHWGTDTFLPDAGSSQARCSPNR
jgi:hypothetical protein